MHAWPSLSWYTFSNKPRVFLFYEVLHLVLKTYTFAQFLGEVHFTLKAAASFHSVPGLWLYMIFLSCFSQERIRYQCLGALISQDTARAYRWFFYRPFVWLEVSLSVSAGGVHSAKAWKTSSWLFLLPVLYRMPIILLGHAGFSDTYHFTLGLRSCSWRKCPTLTSCYAFIKCNQPKTKILLRVRTLKFSFTNVFDDFFLLYQTLFFWQTLLITYLISTLSFDDKTYFIWEW